MCARVPPSLNPQAGEQWGTCVSALFHEIGQGTSTGQVRAVMTDPEP